MVGTEGLEKLSMRRIAEELGASPMALYRHVAGKKELLELLVEEVMAELKPTVRSQPPRARILASLEHTREVMSRHPWLPSVLLAQDPPPSGRPWLTEYLLEALLDAGLDERAAVYAYRSMWQYMTGHVLHVHREAALRERAARAHDSGDDLADFPVLRRALPQLAALDQNRQFRAGLEAQLDGFLAAAESGGEGAATDA